MSIQRPSEEPSSWTTPVNPAWFGPLYWASQNPYAAGIQKLLLEDRVEAAYDLAEKIGVGSYAEYLPRLNLIAGERETRVRGEKTEISEDLAIEYIADEQGGRASEIAAFAAQLIAGERNRFGWQGAARVLITLLPQDFDAPWATARYGYCAKRRDYFKIGIPFHVIGSPALFGRVMTHEYAHVISQTESKERVPEWVSEGFSVYASNDHDPRTREAFLRQKQLWLDPVALAQQFGPHVDLGTQGKWLAYQQAGWLVGYLASLKGEKELIRFLGEYADESFFKNLKMTALGETRTWEALHAIYGVKEADVFSQAYAALGR